MAHLADIASETRIILKLLAAAGILVVVLFLGVNGFSIAKNLLFPPPPEPPKEELGKLPEIPFGKSLSALPEFKINTVSGQLPNYSDRTEVYKIKSQEPSLNALKTTREKLRRAGFDHFERKISDTVYQWQNSSGIFIRYDTISNNFEVDSDIVSKSFPLGEVFSRKDDAFSFAQRFLNNLTFEIEDIDPDKTTLTYYKLDGIDLAEVSSQNQAQIVRVDLFQKNIGEKNTKIYYPEIDKSMMYFYIAPQEDKRPEIVKGRYNHFNIDLSQHGSYPIKTSTQAFEELQRGINSLIATRKENPQSLEVTDVTLGYYLGTNNQQYLLPIFIFKGKDFTAYVKALQESSTEAQTQ